MRSELFKISTSLFLQLLLVFCLHASVNYFVSQVALSPYLTAAYLVNFLLALSELIILLVLGKKLSSNIGFVFMMSSAFKLIVAYAIFNPLFNEDGKITKTEFITVFVPYAVALFIVTIQLMKVLKKTDESQN